MESNPQQPNPSQGFRPRHPHPVLNSPRPPAGPTFFRPTSMPSSSNISQRPPDRSRPGFSSPSAAPNSVIPSTGPTRPSHGFQRPHSFNSNQRPSNPTATSMSYRPQTFSQSNTFPRPNSFSQFARPSEGSQFKTSSYNQPAAPFARPASNDHSNSLDQYPKESRKSFSPPALTSNNSTLNNGNGNRYPSQILSPNQQNMQQYQTSSVPSTSGITSPPSQQPPFIPNQKSEPPVAAQINPQQFRPTNFQRNTVPQPVIQQPNAQYQQVASPVNQNQSMQYQQVTSPVNQHQNGQHQYTQHQYTQHQNGQPMPQQTTQLQNGAYQAIPQQSNRQQNGNYQDPLGIQAGTSMYGSGSGLTGSFQNMNISGSIQPIGINLFAAPPAVLDVEGQVPAPETQIQPVTPSPFSNASTAYKRCTLTRIPQTSALLAKSKLPLGLLITPFKKLLDGDDAVPVVQAPQIVRCKRCRTYINPWVTFVNQGTRWKCNMCFLSNDVPSFFDWDPESRIRVDRNKRDELNHGVIEYVAPQEYMVRPPQPVVFMFVIDVSFGAIQSGMVAVAAKSILDSLDAIPNDDDRTKLGFITFDSSMHFYNLSATGSGEPQMLVVSDLEQTFLPAPCDLLVSLKDSRKAIEGLLLKLPGIFGNSQQTFSAFGKALRAAEKMIGSIGGKIICLQHSLPNHDDGSLTMREDAKLLGTPKEAVLLQPATSFYKTFAVECSPSQISLDLFLFNSQYADVATLNSCSKFTGGTLFYYPGFSALNSEDYLKFSTELCHLLTRPLGLEAVLRIRASQGVKMSTFHGNFFLRSTDLLSLPNVSPDHSYTIEMSLTEDLLKSTTVCFQTALLYTSDKGERRIRVLTLCLPVTSSISELYMGADQEAVAALLIKKAVDRSLTSKMEDAREALVYKLTEIISTYKTTFKQSSHPQQLMICKNLQFLPVFILGMTKNIILREGKIPSDMRAYMLSWQYATCPEVALVSIYPRLWSLQDILSDENIGLPESNGSLRFPSLLNLSSEKLSRNGIFLLENGQEIYIWVGRNCNPDLLTAFFGHPSLDAIPVGKCNIPNLQNSYNGRLMNLLNHIRDRRLRQASLWLPLFIAREDGDPALRARFLANFVEDRIENNLSYPQFLSSIRDKIQKMK